MNRRQKIALLKGIIKGHTTIQEVMEPRFAIAEIDSETGELKPWRASMCNADRERIERNAELLRMAANDPTINVIKISRE
jgi:hypothetical protein